jgi:hypothetical protein
MTKFETLATLVYSQAKTGKTTLAATCPLPIIALDAEGGWKWIPRSPLMREIYGRDLVRVSWDPVNEEPPIADGSWDICVVTVHNWQRLQRAYEWFANMSSKNDIGAGYKTIVLDSVSEIQRRCKANIFKAGQDVTWKHWGQLLDQMDAVIRGFRDLILIDTNDLEVAFFIAEAMEENGRWVPNMQGQIKFRLPYWVDICGWLYTEQQQDENGQPFGPLTRKLWVAPHDKFLGVGERVQGLIKPIIERPNMTEIFNTIYQR